MWARRLLKSGRARIYQYRPFFTLMVVDYEDGTVQAVEYKSDTGTSTLASRSVLRSMSLYASRGTCSLASRKSTMTSGSTAGQGGTVSATAGYGLTTASAKCVRQRRMEASGLPLHCNIKWRYRPGCLRKPAK